MDYKEVNEENETIEKNEFYNKLNEDENVKKIKKHMKYDIISIVLAILLIPTISILGLYYKLNFLYIIAGIVALAYVIFYYINKYIIETNIINSIEYYIKDFLQKKYTIENISEEEIEDIVEENDNFLSEDSVIRKLYDLNISIDKHVLRFNKNNKFLDLFEYEDYKYGYKSYIKTINLVVVANTIENKMLFLKTIYDDSILNKENNNTFEKRIYDYKEQIENILKKIDNKKSEEHINLTEEQKSKLVSIYNKYNINFEIIIKSGKLFIVIEKCINKDVKCIKRTYDIENCLDELLDMFIDM